MPSDRLVQNGGWLHKRLNGGARGGTNGVNVGVVAVADAKVQDATYKALFGLLRLEEDHVVELIGNRGLDNKQLCQFRTLRNVKPWEVCKELMAKGHILSGVPGFYLAKDKNSERQYWNFNYKPGMIFKLENSQQQTQALQMRLDSPLEKANRYRLFSSGRLCGGASSGAPIHVARPEVIYDDRVWVTEGALKAIVLSHQIKAVVLGAMSAVTWPSVVTEISCYYTGREIVIAYDQDKYTNSNVMRAVNELGNALKEKGAQVNTADWDRKYKGADDAALNGCRFVISRY